MFIVQIAGNLGKDPETRFTANGQKVTSFNIAVNQRKGKEDVTIWVRVTVWGDRFDKMLSFMKKGSSIIVIGRMNPPSSYVDKEGRTQMSLEVTAEMLEFSPFGKGDRPAEGAAAPARQSQQNQGNPYESAPGRQPAYGNAPAAGQGAHHDLNGMDEEPLPF